VLGCVLVVLYRLLISEAKLDRYKVSDVAIGEPVPAGGRPRLRTLVNTPSVLCAYVGSGLQLFVAGSLFAWLPSYVGRAYDLPPDRAAGIAAIAILLMGVGMIVCGAVTDRLSRHVPIRKWTSAIVYSALSLVFLGAGFSLAPGGAQLFLLAVGVFFAAGTAGPAGAMVANLTAESIRATALGTLTLANNLLGLAAGPLVVGMLADSLGLVPAMRFVPLAAAGALVALALGRRAYPASLARVSGSAVTR
jgi:MFS family permease